MSRVYKDNSIAPVELRPYRLERGVAQIGVIVPVAGEDGDPISVKDI